MKKVSMGHGKVWAPKHAHPWVAERLQRPQCDGSEKHKWIKAMISVFTTHKRVWGYMGKFLYWQCSLISKEMLSCFLSPGHVWLKRCIKHPCLWVQLLIRLLGAQAVLENASLFFHVFMEPEFQGGRRNLGRQEESSPCSSLGSHWLRSAEHLPRWGWQFTQKIGSGEKTPLHVAASDANLGRDLSGEAWPFLGSENSLFRSGKERPICLFREPQLPEGKVSDRCGYQTNFFRGFSGN